MRLVIDIPDWRYKSICKGIEAFKRCGVVCPDPVVQEAIYKGMPLPEGHEYIDRNNAITSVCQWFTTAERNRQFSFTTNLAKQIVTDILWDEPIIIKTEKEGEQE